MATLQTRISTLLFLGAATLFLTGAVPGTPEECKKGASGEKTLSACTAYIDSGQFKGKDLAGAYYLRAIAHADFDEIDKAMADITKAIELDSSNAEFYFMRGNIQWDTVLAERNEKAVLADYAKAISLSPNTSLFFGNRCYVYTMLKQPQPEKAITDCHKALELDPENQGAATLLEQLEKKP